MIRTEARDRPGARLPSSPATLTPGASRRSRELPVPRRRPRKRALALALVAAGAIAIFAPALARADQAVPALPPPVTRGVYRSHWFEFLNALLEDDASAATRSLGELRRAARTVGVRSLTDFSRTALHEARKAESLGATVRAVRGYDAAVELDSTSYDAQAARVAFQVRQGRLVAALGRLPALGSSLVASREPRFALASVLLLWGACAVGATVLGSIVVLFLRHSPRMRHDVGEVTRRLGRGASLPLTLLALALPFAFGLGPPWILLAWGAVVFPYASRRERRILAAGLILLAFVPWLLEWLGRENIIRRSPLYVAAVDLEEQREDGSAEDGLRQASAVFPEDSDVWFLLGMYAQRAGNTDRAIASYDHAIQADPRDFRPFLNRGNVHFEEGDLSSAIRDYDAAAQRAPRGAEAHYNLSVARGESYDFDGQSKAIAAARLISASAVDAWSERASLSRVVPASYPVARARERVERWNAQRKSRRLPGHSPPWHPLETIVSPFTLGPLATLAVGLLIARGLRRRGVSEECLRCAGPFCRFCKRYGDPPLYCRPCVRLHMRKEDAGIDAHVVQAEEIRTRTRWRNRACRYGSLLFPGAHLYLTQRPLLAVATLLAFFFALSTAVIDERFFDPRQLAAEGVWRGPTIVAAGVAALLWILQNVSAWRESHGP